MERGAIYARVSTSKSADLQDPGRQLRACQDRLKELGVADVDVYSERGSGADDSREDFQALVEAIQNGEYDCICMSEVSRLARRTSIAATFIDTCIEDQGIPIYLTDDMIDVIKPSDPMSSFFAKQLALWYEEERKQAIRRIKDGMKQAQRKGKWTSKPPKGFTTDTDGYLIPDIEEFLQVQTALERVLEGDSKYQVANETGVSRRTLTRILDDPERLQLYLDGTSSDEQLQEVVDDTEIEPIDLPPGVERQVREVVRDELTGQQTPEQ